jgi:integrase
MWPTTDQTLRSKYFEFSSRWADTPVTDLAPATAWAYQDGNASWLGFNFLIRPNALALDPDARVDPQSVNEYCVYLAQDCEPLTVATKIFRLHAYMRIVAPHVDWFWLYTLFDRLRVRCKSKLAPHVLSPDLYRLGLGLMDSALVQNRPDRRHASAIRFRDGLLISVQIQAPMRARALVSLNFEEHLWRQGNCWAITVPKEFTKTNVEQSYMLTSRLSRYLDLYLGCLRGSFAIAGGEKALWVSDQGRLTRDALYQMFKRRTFDGLGLSVGPHTARSAAATFLARTDPANAFAAMDLLGHTSLNTTAIYMRGVKTRFAGREVAPFLYLRGPKLTAHGVTGG